MWLCAKAFADWIPPEVAGDVFDGFVRPQDMIVVPSLPKTGAACLAEFVSGSLFEPVNEIDQVACIV
jgi:hypothetical protein